MGELTAQQLLVAGAESNLGGIAMRTDDDAITHGEHLERVQRLAAGLADRLGVKPRDRIAVLADNGREYVELWHAAAMGAATICPLNTRTSESELSYILADASPVAIFCDESHRSIVDRVRGVLPDVTVIQIDAEGRDGYDTIGSAISPRLPAPPRADDPCILMYTGGTTGKPKGVVLGHGALVNNIYTMTIAYEMDRSSRYLAFMPLFHIGGTPAVFVPFCLGASVTVMSRFEAGAVIETIDGQDITHTGAVPTMWAMILDHPSFDPKRLSSLRAAAYGAAQMPPALLARLGEALPNLGLAQMYGMTEATGGVTLLTPTDHRAGDDGRLRSVGRPVLGARLAIRDADGHDLPAGLVGEICVQHGALLQEYWKLPDATAEALCDGWYRTGDAGWLDEAGYLHVSDRVKDMIITGGENVYSVEVENAIATCPGVREVAVVGVPHDIWGEAVHAVVVPHEGAQLSEEAVIRHASAALASFKVPKSVEIRSEPLPLSAAGKVLKRELRKASRGVHEREQEREVRL